MGEQHLEGIYLVPHPSRSAPSSRRQVDLVSFHVSTESLTLIDHQEMKNPHSDNEISDTEGTLDENHRYSTVLLDSAKKKKSMCWGFCKSYHSADPDMSLTPFAIVLLAVLFVIYVLNQADRLVLPVAIPAGLRCEISETECRTAKGRMSNASNQTVDCIDFNDYEQGLLTGM